MNLETIQLVVFDGTPINQHLLKWANRFPIFLRATDIMPKPYPDLMAMWRNSICDWFLKKTDLSHILMLDADMIPLAETSPIYTEDAPIMGCEYIGSDGEIAHSKEGHVGCGCIRMSREALKAVPKPWFNFILSDDGFSDDQCECGYFCEKAMSVGLHPVTRGKMGHIIKTVVTLEGEDKPHLQLLSRWNKE